MRNLEDWKSTKHSKKRHLIVLLFLGFISAILWGLYLVGGDKQYFKICLYPTILFFFQLPIFYLQHILKAAESKPLTWVSSPITYLLPVVIIAIWSGFN
jgi:hypothetical protein